MRTGKFVLGLAFCAIVCLQFAHAQANVNESLETVFLYVDGTLGSDSNPGTQALPFKTIGKAASVALANNHKSLGTHVSIASGPYRESLALAGTTGATSLPITLEASTLGQVRVSGADVWTGWQPYSANPAIYTHAWPYAWGFCPRATSGPMEQDINLRREMIFVNSTMLTQVLSLDQMTRGTFFVDEPNAVVYIFPAVGTNVNNAMIEVGTRASLLSTYNLSNFVVRGIRFEQSNECRDNDAVNLIYGTNVLFESDGINRNNAGGFAVNDTQFFTVRNTVAKHNGERGFKSYQAKNGVWANDEADYNNWRGAQGGIYGWSGGGFYFYEQHNNTLQGLKMFYNMSHGIHWDTDIANVSARSLIASYNLRAGLVLEKAEGPVALTNSSVCFNSPLMGYADGGMIVRASTYANLTGNTFAQNDVAQLTYIGVMGPVPVTFTNYETGQNYSLFNANITMRRDIIEGSGTAQLFYDFDQDGVAWSNFVATLVSDNNTWWNGDDAQSFTVPVPAWFTTTDWPGWLAVSGQDKHSKFAAPAVDPTIPCQVQADAPDFWIINRQTGQVTVTAGTPALFGFALMPLGGFNGQTTLAAFGTDQIPGASGSWSQTAITGSGTSTYTINTSSATPTGNYPVTFTAQSGNLTRTVTAWLTVQ